MKRAIDAVQTLRSVEKQFLEELNNENYAMLTLILFKLASDPGLKANWHPTLV